MVILMQPADNPVHINRDFIERNTDFRSLIEQLQQAFVMDELVIPPRHHHDFPNRGLPRPTTMLIMPAWAPGMDAGIKVVTINPHNALHGLPSLQGTYLYLDAETGSKKAEIEATALTAFRTAATSALASKLLSNEQADSLLMVGTGSLAVPLIRAHKAVRNLQQVLVWGRDRHKAEGVVARLQNQDFAIRSVHSIAETLPLVDIVSTATLSATPLLAGRHLRPGQHLDLVGSFKPDHREADDDCIVRSTLFVDSLDSIQQGGDIAIPLRQGLIQAADIKADLFGLCQGRHQGRSSNQQITLFNSVGHALEDLIAARYYYSKL